MQRLEAVFYIVDFVLSHNGHFGLGGGGGWHDATVYCCRLHAPIGRSPFAALPLDPFPP